MSNVDISVIVPVYNVESYLPDFFISLAEQTYQGFRVVMVDDCSTDRSFHIAQELGEAFGGNRFVLLKNDSNMGLSGARNSGLDWVSEHPTEYVSFLDPDDWFEATYLEDLHSAAVVSDADLTISGIIRFEDESNAILSTEMVHYPQDFFSDSSECSDLAFINPCAYSKLFRFDPIRNVRFRDIKRSEDTCYLFESLPYLKSLKFTNNALYHYRVRTDSLSGAMGEDKHASMHEEFPRLLSTLEGDGLESLREMAEAQVFIRSSIGGVMRLAFGDMFLIMKLPRKELEWLDCAIPSWRRNKYLSFGRWKSRTNKQLAVKVTAALYKAHLFPAFICLYWLIAHVLKKEVRA